MTKKLIVNADDLGMSEGINRGILEAHLAGIVTSTTALMTMPAARAGIELVQRQAPGLGLGLHLNLTYGRPLLSARQVPSLVRSSGRFVSLPRGLGLRHHWRHRDIEAELNAQFERFVEVAGCLPDHLDSHQLIGSLSAECREVMLELSETHGLPVRRGGRSLFGRFERQFAARGGLQRTMATALFKRYPQERHAHIFDRTPPSPDHFEFDFYARNATPDRLLRILEALPAGVTELVCHPGYAGGDGDGYRYRERELVALTDARVKHKIAEAGIDLTTFAVLATPADEAGEVSG